jgi:type III restriction enzyme
MGSNVQVEQVIGRVLRQPCAQHFPDQDLNTAVFFVRMDNRQAGRLERLGHVRALPGAADAERIFNNAPHEIDVERL